MKYPNTRRGFTLIELLVAILIIGILAAVAVPQYQQAVVRSRYNTLKHLVKSLAEANEIYYLANGSYTANFEDLDVNTPAFNSETVTPTISTRESNWGHCEITLSHVACRNKKVGIRYQLYFQHGNAGRKDWAICVADTDLSSLANRVCKQETQQNAPINIQPTYVEWKYPR